MTVDPSHSLDESDPRVSRPWDFLNPDTTYISKEEYIERYSTCTSCERFNNKLKMCRECNCFMIAKCAMEHAYCPLGKWGTKYSPPEE